MSELAHCFSDKNRNIILADGAVMPGHGSFNAHGMTYKSNKEDFSTRNDEVIPDLSAYTDLVRRFIRHSILPYDRTDLEMTWLS